MIMKKYEFNFRDIETPKNGYQVYTDTYWLCENGDIKRALFYGESPQCNKNKKICELSYDLSNYAHMNLQTVFVPVAYLPIRY